MPILWKVLAKGFFKLFVLSLVTLIGVLLLTQVHDIAHLLNSAQHKTKALFFLLFQILYLLPLIFPIAAFFSALLLLSQFSSTGNLSACKALGISLPALSRPLLFSFALLSLVNLLFAHEIAPRARGKGQLLLHSIAAENPLLLLQASPHLTVIRDPFPQSKKEFLLSAQGEGRDPTLLLVVGKELSLQKEGEEEALVAKELSLLSGRTGTEEDPSRLLFLENIEQLSLPLAAFSPLLPFEGEGRRKLAELPFHLLRRQQQLSLEEGGGERGALWELSRRHFLAALSFALPCLGIALGVRGEGKRERGGPLLSSSLFLLLTFSCFFLAKSQKSHPLVMGLLLLLPFLAIATLFISKIRRAS